jgi:hypothetical protein
MTSQNNPVDGILLLLHYFASGSVATSTVAVAMFRQFGTRCKALGIEHAIGDTLYRLNGGRI